MKNAISNEVRLEAVSLVVLKDMAPKEAAEKVKVSERSVRRWVSNKELVAAVKAEAITLREEPVAAKEEEVVVADPVQKQPDPVAEQKPYIHRNGKIGKVSKRRSGSKLSKVLAIVKKELAVHDDVEVSIELLADKNSEIRKIEKELAEYITDKLYDGNLVVGRRMVGIALDDIANGVADY